MVCFVSALLPPYEAYNSAWYPSLALLLACMGYAALLTFGVIGRAVADRMLPRKAGAPQR